MFSWQTIFYSFLLGGGGVPFLGSVSIGSSTNNLIIALLKHSEMLSYMVIFICCQGLYSMPIAMLFIAKPLALLLDPLDLGLFEPPPQPSSSNIPYCISERMLFSIWCVFVVFFSLFLLCIACIT